MVSENELKPTQSVPKTSSDNPVPRLDSIHLREETAEKDVRVGVKAAAATEKVYSRYSKWCLFFSIILASFTYWLDKQTTSSYLPFAASAYNKHSEIATIKVLESVVAACGQPLIAKFADVRSRAQAYVLVIAICVLGYILIASAHGIGSLGAGVILYAIGYSCVTVLHRVIIADVISIQWRGAISGLTDIPSLITAFIGSNVAAQILTHYGWRWGYGMFAILIAASWAPLFLTLLWAERKAKRMGLFSEVILTDVGALSKGWMFFKQLDLFGLALMGTSVALILLPLTLAVNAPGGWHSHSMISMVVVGCVLLPITAFWEIKFAARPILIHQLLTNKTVIFSILIAFFFNIIFVALFFFIDNIYEFIRARGQALASLPSLLDATYFSRTLSVSSHVFLIAAGFAMRLLHGYKLLLVVGSGMRLIGVAIMIHARNAQGSVVEIVWTQILQGIGQGITLTCTNIASQAEISHVDLAITIALVQLWSDLGTAFGGAIAGAIWTNTMPQKFLEYIPNVNATYRAELFGSITSITKLSYDNPIRQGVISAYSDVMKIILIPATVLSVIPFALSIFMPSWYLGDEQNAVEAGDRKGEYTAPLPGRATMEKGSPRNEKLESP